jgi:hypothetical protein
VPPAPSLPALRAWFRDRALAARAFWVRYWPGLLLAALAVTLYGVFRAREAFGCDSWAYVSQARMLRGKDVGLSGGLDPLRFPSIVPLCAELAGRTVVPGMPPGYSVLLALGGALRLETMVSPLVGGLATFLIYFALQARAGQLIALVSGALWAVSPIAIWGGTQIMGDMSAACALLLSYVLLDTGAPFAAGVTLGLSAGIRPTNLLFSAAALVKTKDWQGLFRVALGGSLGLGAWVAFGLGRYAGPHMFGMYGGNAGGITYEAWGHQLSFVARWTTVMFPILLPLAAVAVWRRPKESAPLVVWALAIIGFYVGWRWKYDAWWWTRHVLPAYPALALLGGLGMAELRGLIRTLPSRGMAVALVAANLTWCARFSSEKGLFNRSNAYGWIRDSFELKALLPRDSLIGGVNFSGPLRLYAGIETFRWDHPKAPDLIDYALANRRPVYLLVEPDLYERAPAALALRGRYTIADVKQVRSLGITLRRIVSGPAAAGHGS